MGLTVGRGVAGAGSSSVEAPPHHANISPGLETALFYGLIMTRRAARLGLHRARNVERDDARDLARCELGNPGRAVCWSGRRIARSAVEMLLQAYCLALGNRGRARAPASGCIHVRAEAMYSAEQSQVYLLSRRTSSMRRHFTLFCFQLATCKRH